MQEIRYKLGDGNGYDSEIDISGDKKSGGRYKRKRSLGQGTVTNVGLFTNEEETYGIAVKKLREEHKNKFAAEIEDSFKNEKHIGDIAYPNRGYTFISLESKDNKARYRLLSCPLPGYHFDTALNQCQTATHVLQLLIVMARELHTALHQKGILHGDIKSDCFFIEMIENKSTQQPELRAVLNDFGFSYKIDEKAHITGENADHWPPERCRTTYTKAPDASYRQDVYSFGYLVYCHAYDKTEEKEKEKKKQNQPSSELIAVSDCLATLYNSFFRTCLEPDPENRPADMSFIIHYLENALADEQKLAATHTSLRPGAI